MIGIIGLGFLGSAVAASYNKFIFYDPFKDGSVKFEHLIGCDTIFISVPPPQLANGECDTSVVDDTLNSLVELKFKGLVIAKSTAPYEIYEKYADILDLVFIPELLRANTAVKDYLASTFMTIGAQNKRTFDLAVKTIQASNLKCEKFNRISIREACLMKYFENSFLATKVSLMNEFRDLAESVGTSWENIVECLTQDERISPDHTQVPGPDGKFGWGGHCFPKDTSALLAIAKNCDIRLTTLEAAVESNKHYRDI